MPNWIEKLGQLWARFWALSWWWKGSVSGGAALLLLAVIVGLVLASGGRDNTAVSGVFQAPTATATTVPAVTPTPAQTPTPTTHQTPNNEPSPTSPPGPTTAASTLEEQQPPSVGNPPPPAETPTSPPPAPTPTPGPAPKPTPVPTPTPLPRPSYWILCLGSCVFLTPEVRCVSYDIVGISSFKKACASPWFPPLCDLRFPATCEPAPPGWSVFCDGVQVPAQITCDHSLDGSFHCSGDSDFGTSCFPLQNVCSPPEQMPTYSIITCSRTDLGTEVTCIKTSADYGPMFECDSPTVGSFTCHWMPDNVFTCP